MVLAKTWFTDKFPPMALIAWVAVNILTNCFTVSLFPRVDRPCKLDPIVLKNWSGFAESCIFKTLFKAAAAKLFKVPSPYFVELHQNKKHN